MIKIRKNKYFRLLPALGFILWSQATMGQDECCGVGCNCAAGDISPAGIMNDHLHEKGTWMLSYTYGRMDMQGNIMGTTPVSNGDVYNNSYLMSPNKMTTTMQMLMIMYGLSDKVTLMLMPLYNSAGMNMNMYGSTPMVMPGMSSIIMPNSQTISGFGDTRLYALYGLENDSKNVVVASLGLSLPTGSISKKAFPDVYDNIHADYNMQPGSGTVDFLPGLSFWQHGTWVDWGAQVLGTWRPFYNSNGYRFGQEGIGELWAAKRWCSWASTSVRAEAVADGKLSGTDNNVYAILEPSADAGNYGGFRSYIYPGINFYPGTFLSTTCKVKIEYGLPLYQYAEGIQMASRSNILANIELIF